MPNGWPAEWCHPAASVPDGAIQLVRCRMVPSAGWCNPARTGAGWCHPAGSAAGWYHPAGGMPNGWPAGWCDPAGSVLDGAIRLARVLDGTIQRIAC